MILKFFSIIFLITLIFNTGVASALSNSGDENWNYYKQITIMENSGKNLKDYQILLEFYSPDFLDNAKNDGSDIRFTSYGNELNMWIEEFDVSRKTARIWVKVPDIPANGEVKIKMFYGNEKAQSVSDGNTTMDFFDEFDDEMYEDRWHSLENENIFYAGKSMMNRKWLESGGTIKPPDINIVPVIYVEDDTFSDNIIFETKLKGTSVGVVSQISDLSSLCEFSLKTGDIGKSIHIDSYSNYMTNQFNSTPLPGINSYSWYIIRATISAKFAKAEIYDHNWNFLNTVTIKENYNTGNKVGLISGFGSEWDWFRIRKYTFPEPTISISTEYNIENIPLIILTQSVTPTKILDGEGTIISIIVENIGGISAIKGEIEYKIPDGFEILNKSESLTIESIGPGKKRSLKYSLKAIEPSEIVFEPTIVTYEDVDGRSFSSDSNSIRVQVGNASSVSKKAEVPGIEWYKESQTNIFNPSIQQNSDGGYIITGTTSPADMILIKVDGTGNEMWNKTFGGLKEDRGLSVWQTSDGGYIITGYTFSFGAGENDVYLVKTDTNGNEEWSRTFGGPSNDKGNSVLQTVDGGYIIAGITKSFGAGGDDIYVIKTNRNGNEEWSQTYGGPKWDEGYSIHQTSDGGYVITGKVDINDFYLLKIDGNGTRKWDRTFEGYCGYSVQQTIDGGYIIVGSRQFFGDRLTDVYLLKTDEDGNEEWNYAFGGPSLDAGYSVQQTSNGGYIIAGKAEGSDIYLLKTDANGTEEWIRTFGDLLGEISIGRSVQQTSDGGYILASSSPDTIWLVKLLPEVDSSVTTTINSGDKISGFEILLCLSGLLSCAYFLRKK